MLKENALTTCDEVKTHLGIDLADVSKDDLLESLINGFSTFAASYCKRVFRKQEYNAVLDGDGTADLVLPQYPVDPDATLVVQVDNAAVSSSEYDLDEKRGIIYRANGWPKGRRNIKAQFTAGWTLPKDADSESVPAVVSDLPDDLSMAVKRMVAKVFEKRNSEGAGTVTAGNLTVSWSREMDPEITSTLNLYRKNHV